jgi:SnoaL-like polyketide cyclase
MKSLGWKTIVTTAAVAGLSAFAIAATPAQAASSAAGAQAHAAAASQAPAALSAKELAGLPLTNRHLTRHEIANLAVVLNAYYVAQGATLNVNGFIDDFAKGGVFNDEVAGKSYTGKALGDVVIGMADVFPDVHRDLKSITVSGDEISLELSIDGTFEGPLQTPAGTLKPNGAKIAAPTADFWYLHDGKVVKFDCYVGYTDMYAQMGVNLDWAGAIANS